MTTATATPPKPKTKRKATKSPASPADKPLEFMTDVGRTILATFEDLVSDPQRLQEAADEMLMAKEGQRDFTPAELALLMASYGNQEDVKRPFMQHSRITYEFRRANQARVYLLRGGTKQQYADARQKLGELEDAQLDAKQRFEKAEDLAARQAARSELNDIEAQITKQRARVADMQTAREQLTNFAPKFAADKYKAAVRDNDALADVKQQIHELSMRRKNADAIAEIDLTQVEGRLVAVRHARKYWPPDHPHYPDEPHGVDATINQQAWREFVDDEQFSIPLMEKELRQLNEQRAELEGEATEAISFHAIKYGI